MGGKALKTVTINRLEADKYFELTNLVTYKLVCASKATAFDVIPAYKSKESYGDMDILVDKDGGFGVDDIKKLFAPTEIVVNGDVISFDYLGFQIDIILVPQHSYIYAYDYFSYNDLGGLLGKMCTRFGLKHGHTGLFYPVPGTNHNIELTVDTRDTFRFLGLDYHQFATEGFVALEDVFDFVASSLCFNPDDYLPVSTRNAKRATYAAFLEYCKGYVGPKCEETYTFDKIAEFFGSEFLEKYEAVAKEVALVRLASGRLNGFKVSELTGVPLSTNELGSLMKELHAKLTPARVVLMFPHELDEVILATHKELFGLQ